MKVRIRRDDKPVVYFDVSTDDSTLRPEGLFKRYIAVVSIALPTIVARQISEDVGATLFDVSPQLCGIATCDKKGFP